MKKEVYKVDKQGFVIETHVADVDEFNNVLDEDKLDYIPFGFQRFYKPRWNGTEWIEGATKEEIDEITKIEPTLPTQEEIANQRLSDLELMLVELLSI